jgi:hypothetical protein
MIIQKVGGKFFLDVKKGKPFYIVMLYIYADKHCKITHKEQITIPIHQENIKYSFDINASFFG